MTQKIKNTLAFLGIAFLAVINLQAQDTTVVSAFNYGSKTRDTVIAFPTGNQSYQKILMYYNMRCKNANVSTGANRNLGCGEWDYSCNTYLTDSSKADSFLSSIKEYDFLGVTGSTLSYNNAPQFNYHRSWQRNVNLQNIISEDSFKIGLGALPKSDLMPKSSQAVKSYALYTLAEMQAAGLTVGNINALFLDATTAGKVNNLQIRLKNSLYDSLNLGIDHDSFMQVYSNSPTFAMGNNRLQFYNDFVWDGISNILVQFSYSNTEGVNSPVFNGFDDGIPKSSFAFAGNAFSFKGNSYIETNSYKGLLGTQDRTIDAWIKTTTVDGEIVSYGTDRSGEKWVFRINGNGAIRVEINGGYIVGSTNILDNQWHHVACVFTGTMLSETKLYVDGKLELVGAIVDLAVNTTTGINLRINRGVNNRYFEGDIDEVRVWDIALSATQISQYFKNKVLPTNSLYSNIMLHYDFNQGSSNKVIIDYSAKGNHATVKGIEAYSGFLPNQIFKDFVVVNRRPNIQFLRGTYMQTKDSIAYFDSLVQPFVLVKRYQIYPKPNAIANDSVAEIENKEVWNSANKKYYFSENGLPYDSANISTSATISNTTDLPYFRRYASAFEIMSFVTPYGIGLDFGTEGKTWIFDVTDFTPIMKGNKRLFMSRGGEWQEEMDIKFMFIKGTPARNVLDIAQIWPTAIYQPNYTQILENKAYFPPINYAINPLGKSFKVRSAITGHGGEGEFIPRNHSITVEGKTYNSTVWKKCGNNPVFPQGGTWIYDRAGWCPGMATDINEYDITAQCLGKTSVAMDYQIDAGSGDSRYIVNNQIVTYGAYNYTHDAALTEVISPSKRPEYAKTNPTCVSPQIRIKNTGSTVLINAKIDYWVNDKNNKKTQVWYGNLKPNEETIFTIDVNQSVWSTAFKTNSLFYASIVEANGMADENTGNNTVSSEFDIPEVLPNHIIVFIRTNGAGAENSVSIVDDWGTKVYERVNMASNTFYRDTVKLGLGCHTFSMKDSDNDGINFWANNDGAGYARILTVGGGYNKTFQPDFGSEINFSFTVNHQLAVSQIDNDNLITCYPNPTNGLIYLDGQGVGNATYTVYNAMGQMVQPKASNDTDNLIFDFSSFPKGMYLIHLETENGIVVKKILVE